MPSNRNLPSSSVNCDRDIHSRRRQRIVNRRIWHQRRRIINISRAQINNESTLNRIAHLSLQIIINDPFANQLFNGSPFY